MPLGPTSDFTPVAARYDATRHIPAACLRACYARLAVAGLFPARGRILDAGCGTGQIGLPLAEDGYGVEGYDVSAAMIDRARAKARPGWDARYAVADIRALPVRDGIYDAVVVSKLFMHMAGWQAACRELIRVARPAAPIVHIRDRGVLGTAVRRHFTARVRAAGHRALFLGPDPSENADLVAYMAAQGRPTVPIATEDIAWRFTVTAADTLRGLHERIFAEFWYLPEPVYAAALAETEAWVAGLPEGAATEETMTPYLAVDLFRAAG